MRNLNCKHLKEVNTRECSECFDLMKSDKDYKYSLLGNSQILTRAQCVRHNGEYTSDPYVKIDDDGYIKSDTVEFIENMVQLNDENACFEIGNVIWVGLEGMKEYLSAIKGFEKELKREGFEIVSNKELKKYELKGIWYKFIKRNI